MSPIVTKHAFFVGHLASSIISFWRSRDLPKITLTSKYTYSVCLHCTEMFNESHLQKKKLTKKNTFIYSYYLLKNICQPRSSKLSFPSKTAENIFGKT